MESDETNKLIATGNSVLKHCILSVSNSTPVDTLFRWQKLPAKGFEVIVMPIKLTGGSGGPARLLARFSDDTSAAMAFNQASSHYLLLLLVSFTVLKSLC